MNIRLVALLLAAVISGGVPDLRADNSAAVERTKVYVVPVREDIASPLVFLVRRSVKDALASKADLLVLDMDTHGGSGESMMEIIEILNQFKGETATYVNRKAFSAGALISFATKKIFMAVVYGRHWLDVGKTPKRFPLNT